MAMSGSLSAANDPARAGVQRLCLRIPATPSFFLSPNSRVHWAVKARAATQYRALAYLAAKDALATGPGWTAHDGPVQVFVSVGWEPGRKRQDADNLIASLKAAMDGVADAIGVNDKHFRYGEVFQERDGARCGYVLIRLLASETNDLEMRR